MGLPSMVETFRYAAVGVQGAVLNHAVPAHAHSWYSASLKSLSPPRGSWTPSARYGAARWSPGWRWWRGAACCPGWTPRMLSRFPVCRWWLHPEYKHGSLDEATIHRKPMDVYEDKPKLVQTKTQLWEMVIRQLLWIFSVVVQSMLCSPRCRLPLGFGFTFGELLSP